MRQVTRRDFLATAGSATALAGVHSLSVNWTNTLVPPPYDPIGFNVARVYKDGVKLEFIPIDPI